MENVLPLEGEQINPYLKRLSTALGALGRHLLARSEEDVADYCDLIVDTLKFFQYSRSDQKEGVDARLRIDPTFSGFPNSVELIRLFQEKSRAAQVLEELPEQEELALGAMKKILDGTFPREEQLDKIRLDYYRRLHAHPIVRNFEVIRVREVKGGEAMRRYHLHWRGLDQSKNLFVAYSLDLEQDKDDEPLSRRPGRYELFTILENKFGLGAGHMMKSVDAIASLHPKDAQRHVIGPYYCELTRNNDTIGKVFTRVPSPYILRYRCERVVSEKTLEIKSSFFRRPNQKELISEERVENFAFCPQRIRQELGELFLSGGEEDYKVVGVTEEGMIID